MVSAAGVREILAGITGDDFVRDAVAADAVAGVQPSLVVSPGTEAEVSAVLACASRDGLAVVVRGGGTKLDWGAPPSRCDVLLSTARLDAVVEHEPGDLVCVVQAGLRLDALQAALAPHGQRLALDPGHGVAATLGGIAAAGAWGPLRARYGTARDLVIGARFVLADGTVGHSGGKVVKNVAGYDVAKLLIGSLGTLAVVTELSLRLHPLPHASCTLAVEGLDAAGVASVWRTVEGAAVVVSRAVALWPDGVLLLQVDGTEHGVEAQVSALHATGTLRRLDASDAETAWAQAQAAVWTEGATVAAIGVPRTDLAALLDRLDRVAERTLALPSLGIAESRLRPTISEDDVCALRAWTEQRGGHLVLRRPPASLAHLAWPQHDDPALDLMRAVKRSLDPTGTLAPGRFLGGI